MFMDLYPNEYVHSTYGIDFEQLKSMGVHGLLFDIDNTLVPHGQPATEEAIALFQRLHSIGIDTVLISNNQDPRVRPFADAVGSDYMCNAHKPSVRRYREACELMELDRTEVVFIGDQLLTDIWGANRAGIRSILVQPINPKEEIQIVLKRYLEKVVLWFYRHGGSRRRPKIFMDRRTMKQNRIQ